MLTMSERRDLILEYARTMKKDCGMPKMSPNVVDAILGDSRIVDFNINQGPYFGQIFTNKHSDRKDWVASAALFCWAGRHECSGGVVIYTMAGLLSLPVIPEAWHLEFQPGHGLEDRTTICRLIPD